MRSRRAAHSWETWRKTPASLDEDICSSDLPVKTNSPLSLSLLLSIKPCTFQCSKSFSPQSQFCCPGLSKHLFPTESPRGLSGQFTPLTSAKLHLRVTSIFTPFYFWTMKGPSQPDRLIYFGPRSWKGTRLSGTGERVGTQGLGFGAVYDTAACLVLFLSLFFPYLLTWMIAWVNFVNLNRKRKQKRKSSTIRPVPYAWVYTHRRWASVATWLIG